MTRSIWFFQPQSNKGLVNIKPASNNNNNINISDGLIYLKAFTVISMGMFKFYCVYCIKRPWFDSCLSFYLYVCTYVRVCRYKFITINKPMTTKVWICPQTYLYVYFGCWNMCLTVFYQLLSTRQVLKCSFGTWLPHFHSHSLIIYYQVYTNKNSNNNPISNAPTKLLW